MSARPSGRLTRPGLVSPPLVLTLLLVVAVLLLTAGVAAPPARAASGDLIKWALLFVGATDDRDAYFDAARGPDGSLYVCGISDQSLANGRALLAKYKADRTLEWVKTYLPPGYTSATGVSVAVDHAGDVVIAGSAYLGAPSDLYVAKFTATGTPVWSAVQNVVGPYDGAAGLAIGPDDSVYAAGSGWGEASADVIKYDADADPAHPGRGLQLWTHTTAGLGPSPSIDYGALTLDRLGNVYVAGDRTNASGKLDALIIKLGPGGKRRWLRTWDSAAHDSDALSCLTVAGTRVYAGGSTSSTDSTYDALLLCYDTSGRRHWVRAGDDGSGENVSVFAARVDGSGHVYAATEASASDYRKVVLYKRSGSGKLLWRKSYRGVTGDGGAVGYDLAVSTGGDAWIFGYMERSTGPVQYLTVKYGASGARRWASRWNGPPPESLGGQAWGGILAGNVVVTFGEAITASSGGGAEVTWRRR